MADQQVREAGIRSDQSVAEREIEKARLVQEREIAKAQAVEAAAVEKAKQIAWLNRRAISPSLKNRVKNQRLTPRPTRRAPSPCVPMRK